MKKRPATFVAGQMTFYFSGAGLFQVHHDDLHGDQALGRDAVAAAMACSNEAVAAAMACSTALAQLLLALGQLPLVLVP